MTQGKSQDQLLFLKVPPHWPAYCWHKKLMCMGGRKEGFDSGDSIFRNFLLFFKIDSEFSDFRHALFSDLIRILV